MEYKVNMAPVEIQNMKSVIQAMAEAVHTMQSMIMSNVSAGLVATWSVVRKRPKKGSQRESLMELGNGEGSSCSHTSHKPKRLCKRRLAKSMSSSGLRSESDLGVGQ